MHVEAQAALAPVAVEQRPEAHERHRDRGQEQRRADDRPDRDVLGARSSADDRDDRDQRLRQGRGDRGEEAADRALAEPDRRLPCSSRGVSARDLGHELDHPPPRRVGRS